MLKMLRLSPRQLPLGLLYSLADAYEQNSNDSDYLGYWQVVDSQNDQNYQNYDLYRQFKSEVHKL